MSTVRRTNYFSSNPNRPIANFGGAPVRTDIIQQRLVQLGNNMPRAEITKILETDPRIQGWYRAVSSPALVLLGREEPN